MSANDTGVTTTRGGALKRFLLLAGGAVGVGVAGGRTLCRGNEPAAGPTSASSRRTSFGLCGGDWRLGSHAAEHGKRLSPKEQRTPAGRIVDHVGRELGTFKA